MADEFAPEGDDRGAVAGRAVEAGADYLRERFRSGETDAEYTAVDVTTAADREAEGRVLEVIREAEPSTLEPRADVWALRESAVR